MTRAAQQTRNFLTDPIRDEENYYEVFGLTPDASLAEIRKVYIPLALRYHPDKNGNSKESEAAFKAISQIHNVLSNEESRSAYDLNLKNAEMFGRGAADFARQPRQPSPEELRRQEARQEEFANITNHLDSFKIFVNKAIRVINPFKEGSVPVSIVSGRFDSFMVEIGRGNEDRKDNLASQGGVFERDYFTSLATFIANNLNIPHFQHFEEDTISQHKRLRYESREFMRLMTAIEGREAIINELMQKYQQALDFTYWWNDKHENGPKSYLGYNGKELEIHFNTKKTGKPEVMQFAGAEVIGDGFMSVNFTVIQRQLAASQAEIDAAVRRRLADNKANYYFNTIQLAFDSNDAQELQDVLTAIRSDKTLAFANEKLQEKLQNYKVFLVTAVFQKVDAEVLKVLIQHTPQEIFQDIDLKQNLLRMLQEGNYPEIIEAIENKTRPVQAVRTPSPVPAAAALSVEEQNKQAWIGVFIREFKQRNIDFSVELDERGQEKLIFSFSPEQQSQWNAFNFKEGEVGYEGFAQYDMSDFPYLIRAYSEYKQNLANPKLAAPVKLEPSLIDRSYAFVREWNAKQHSVNPQDHMYASVAQKHGTDEVRICFNVHPGRENLVERYSVRQINPTNPGQALLRYDAKAVLDNINFDRSEQKTSIGQRPGGMPSRAGANPLQNFQSQLKK